MSDLTNDFSWSVSRDKTFSECKRKYFYQHYGMWEGWPSGKGDEKAKRLYLLKNLTSPNMYVGLVVHATIKKIIDRIMYKKPFTDSEFVEHIDNRMRRDFEDSLSGKYRNDPKHFIGFREHEYGETISEQTFEDSINFAKHCLGSFFSSQVYQTLCGAKSDDWLSVDSNQFLSFVFEGTKIYVTPDVVVAQGKRTLIVDWKTGRKEDVDYSLQLACYLLFANKQWGCEPNSTDVLEVNLAYGREILHNGMGAKIDWVKSYAQKSIASMRACLVDPSHNIAKEDDFPKRNDERYCKYCNYAAVCKPCSK